MIPFSILWCGFAIFWEMTAMSSGAPFFFLIWGIPFVIIGLYMVFGRFLVDTHRRRKTYYGVTDKRILVVTCGLSRKVKSLNNKSLPIISLTEKSDGRGTITFGSDHPWQKMQGSTSWDGAGTFVPTFEMIDNAREVADKIRELQKTASAD